jgi:hypothetical protein
MDQCPRCDPQMELTCPDQRQPVRQALHLQLARTGPSSLRLHPRAKRRDRREPTEHFEAV